MPALAVAYQPTHAEGRTILEERPELKRSLTDALWARGQLGYKLRGYQIPAYKAVWLAIHNRETLKFCLNINRRWGKTFLLCLIASELANRKIGARIRLAAPTLDELRDRIHPIMEELHADCPEHLRPVWRASRNTWVWPNGSRMKCVGVNSQGYRKLRGSGTDLAIVDEGGFIDAVDKLIFDVLLPQLVDTDGTLIATSTPPDSAAHEFCEFYDTCEAELAFYHADIYSMGLPQWKVDLHARESGGVGTVRWRREWLAEYVTDTELQIIPDWIAPQPETPSPYVRTITRDEYFPYLRHYVVMDIGATRRDFTAVLFCTYHFKEARLYVERELIDRKLPRLRSAALAARIREIERELWGKDTPATEIELDELLSTQEMDSLVVTMPSRWADNNDAKLIVSLATDPNNPLPFTPTEKQSLPRMVNKVREWVIGDRLAVAPECESLLKCLQKGTWRNEDYIGREFVRTASIGHCDALAALVYTIHNVNEYENPIPPGLHYDRTRQRWRAMDEGYLTTEDARIAAHFELPTFDS